MKKSFIFISSFVLFLAVAVAGRVEAQRNQLSFTPLLPQLEINSRRVFPIHPPAGGSNPSVWRPTPRPTNPPSSVPQPLKKGMVELTAETSACGSEHPFQGIFRLCRQYVETGENSAENVVQPKYCTSLVTDKEGRGKVSLYPGNYRIDPPNYCPPGAYCILSQAQNNQNNNSAQNGLRMLIVNPYTWTISPQSFFLPSEGRVEVKATGYNNLLMCPIQAEE